MPSNDKNVLKVCGGIVTKLKHLKLIDIMKEIYSGKRDHGDEGGAGVTQSEVVLHRWTVWQPS